ncbi:hypothetical protein OR1_02353 [Geobacter sp. OR-1]|uniref:ABC transporter substrate-binding protein n=1 Tax=Geobacter sp. OR-1 TaxID=1266765 RepID=UPI0005437C04|nr:ABC transporter substrate-binding protein [Geobacter sp. OR-1]GAM10066.1 hypothetical protein OR1_02353 [Geobacter sp. OR-1]
MNRLSLNETALFLIRVVCAICLFILAPVKGFALGAGDNGISSPSPAEVKRLGENIYRDGLLPDGSPLQGYVRGDVRIDSTVFSCSNCHTRSGLGSVEGQITSPPVNGATLFAPRYLFKDQIKNVISKKRGVTRPATPIRSAYSDESLANAIRYGVNPDGRELSPIMPRYMIEDNDMHILGSYLKQLSSTFSPGVTETTVNFATIVTDDVTPEDRQALLASLETLVTINRQTKTQKKLPQFAKMFRMLDAAFFRDINIATWELKGAPETWRAQLEEYNRKDPVFAILGGISGQEWQPVHDFCEERQIPCLFPITDLPVISETSWYTFYASKGYYQEGETAARFLAGTTGKNGAKVLQIVQPSRESSAFSAGFNDAWKSAGNGTVDTVTLPPDKQLLPDTLRGLIQQYRPTAVVIWSGPEVVNLLSSIDEGGVRA